MKKKLTSLFAASMIVMGLGVVNGSTAANAANCKPNAFGSTDYMGNPKYTCSDGGTYTLKKQWSTQSWDDPYGRYTLKGNGFNSPQQSCKYDSWKKTYICK